MTLHDTVRNDVEIVFCNLNDFAESVVYYPLNGPTRCFSAQVFREALAILPEDGDSVVPVFEVHVNNDSELGISSDELDTGGDMLAFAVRVGEPRSKRSITKLLGHDEGMLVLECR